MLPRINGNSIIAKCTGCNGAIANFNRIANFEQQRNGFLYHYLFLQCANCNMGALCIISQGIIKEFFPPCIDSLPLPEEIPSSISNEFLEAEEDAAISNYRSASAMLRSTLEKTLIANGYTKVLMKSLGKRDNLQEKITLAFEDRVITEARKIRVDEDIRVLGNDVLHDDWREVQKDEFDNSHHYCQRILEDFYSERSSVEKILRDKGRLNSENKAEETGTTIPETEIVDPV